MSTGSVRTATDVARAFVGWGAENSALASDINRAFFAQARPQFELFPAIAAADTADSADKAEKTLQRLKIVTAVADDARRRVTVLTKNQVSASALKTLPDALGDVTINYIGQAGIEPNPPAVPQSGTNASPLCFQHLGRLACGSSVSAAPVPCAGTLGALIRLADGTLCGLTNNHVTGACNHTQLDMHILCPAPRDADPQKPAPTAIGRHHSFIPLASGDPAQVQLQELDVAIFRVEHPNLISSMQGEGYYDTPTATTAASGGMQVKKVGRTTGETHGIVQGQLTTPLAIPYESDRFRSHVYFQNVWVVQGAAGDAFSLAGDSGSLVATEDGQRAVGLVFAGTNGGEASFIIPIDSVLAALGATLVGGHHV